MNKKKTAKGLAVFCGAVIFSVAMGGARLASGQDMDLSGIMYEPGGQSAAVINGSVVKAGDKIGSAEVLEIRQNSVVIKDAGRQTVLSLEGQKPRKDTAFKPLVPKSEPAKPKLNFWGRLAEKFSRRKKTVEEPTRQAAGQFYADAVQFYGRAEMSASAKIKMELYEKALRSAQFALESESPSAAEAKELSGIIADSRTKLSQATELVRRADEMQRLRLDGDRFVSKARGMDDADALARARIRQEYGLALQCYREALNLADDEMEQRELQRTIARVEGRLESLT